MGGREFPWVRRKRGGRGGGEKKNFTVEKRCWQLLVGTQKGFPKSIKQSVRNKGKHEKSDGKKRSHRRLGRSKTLHLQLWDDFEGKVGLKTKCAKNSREVDHFKDYREKKGGKIGTLSGNLRGGRKWRIGLWGRTKREWIKSQQGGEEDKRGEDSREKLTG